MVDNIMRLMGEVHFVSLLIGLSMFIMGLITLRFPAKEINYLYGYRTKRSMKNQQAWDLAQKVSTHEMIRSGLIIIVFALSGVIYNASTLIDSIAGTALMLVMILLLFFRTESVLKQLESK